MRHPLSNVGLNESLKSKVEVYSSPRFHWGVELSNAESASDSGKRIVYIGSNSAANNASNGCAYIVNRVANKELQLMDDGTINFDNIPILLQNSNNIQVGSGFLVQNKPKSGYVVFTVQNNDRTPSDNGCRVAIEIPDTSARPYLLQSRNDGTNTGQIVNALPQRPGDILVGNVTVLNMTGMNFNNYSSTAFQSFINGASPSTTASPGISYGNLITFGTNTAATGEYCTQLATDKSSAATTIRCRGDGAAAWTTWQKLTMAPVSDENMKNIRGNLNTEGALDNVNRMEFKIFAFKGDESQRYRRGVISQQIKKIDKDYVTQVADHLCLDPTPMLLDGLAAIKALRARDEESKERISTLESEVEKFKLLVNGLVETNMKS